MTLSWGMDAAEPHGYEECSGRGYCDKSSAKCVCMPGFEGVACNRSASRKNLSGKSAHSPRLFLQSLAQINALDTVFAYH